MAQAEVGALRVVLSMNAGEFLSAVKTATGGLDRLAVKFGVVAGAAQAFTAGLMQGVGQLASTITGKFSGAIDSVGELVDASSKFGVPIEQLAALKHAAEQGGASLEQLGVGAGILAKNLTAIAGGSNEIPAARALSALGVSATTAAGGVRAVDDVMIDVADKFAAMEDGSAKTALAMQLFGKSGAALIPMLNSGSESLRQMRDEADRLGLILDKDTAAGLEALGDEWAKVSKWMDGFFIQLSGQLLPTLKFLVDRINDWLNTGGGVKEWAKWAGDGIKSIVEWGFQANAMFARLKENAANAGTVFSQFFSGEWSKIAETNAANAARLAEIDRQLNEDLKSIWAERTAAEIEAETARQQTIIPMRQATTKALTDGERELSRLISERDQIYKDQLDPIQRYQAELEKIDILQQQTGLSAVAAGKMQQKAALVAANAYASAAGSIVSDLGQVFEDNKGFAIAAALINTFQAVTNALANVPPPLNYAAAAAALAAGMAQVANIRKTTKSGGGSSGSGDSSLSSAAASSGGRAVPAQDSSSGVSQGVYLTMNGETFGRVEVLRIIDGINSAVADGARITVAPQ